MYSLKTIIYIYIYGLLPKPPLNSVTPEGGLRRGVYGGPCGSQPCPGAFSLKIALRRVYGEGLRRHLPKSCPGETPQREL